jgi:hypothetical protein
MGRSFLELKKDFSLLQKPSASCNAGVVFVNYGANPTIVSYNASAVKLYDATRSVVRFENIGKYFILL